jgi:hypothetical protein
MLDHVESEKMVSLRTLHLSEATISRHVVMTSGQTSVVD